MNFPADTPIQVEIEYTPAKRKAAERLAKAIRSGLLTELIDGDIGDKLFDTVASFSAHCKLDVRRPKPDLIVFSLIG